MPEMIEAVREWLEGEVYASTDGRLRFHARVAANMLAMVERELTLGPEQAQLLAERLRSLGVASEDDLSAAIRAGELDGRYEQVKAVVSATVRDKLAVANPAYIGDDQAGTVP
jgi:Domain of unknown function (DUF6285)